MTKPIPPKVRQAIIDFPDNPARGQVTRFCKANSLSRSVFYKIKTQAKQQGATLALTPGRPGPGNPPPGKITRCSLSPRQYYC